MKVLVQIKRDKKNSNDEKAKTDLENIQTQSLGCNISVI